MVHWDVHTAPAAWRLPAAAVQLRVAGSRRPDIARETWALVRTVYTSPAAPVLQISELLNIDRDTVMNLYLYFPAFMLRKFVSFFVRNTQLQKSLMRKRWAVG